MHRENHRLPFFLSKLWLFYFLHVFLGFSFVIKRYFCFYFLFAYFYLIETTAGGWIPKKWGGNEGGKKKKEEEEETLPSHGDVSSSVMRISQPLNPLCLFMERPISANLWWKWSAPGVFHFENSQSDCLLWKPSRLEFSQITCWATRAFSVCSCKWNVGSFILSAACCPPPVIHLFLWFLEACWEAKGRRGVFFTPFFLKIHTCSVNQFSYFSCFIYIPSWRKTRPFSWNTCHLTWIGLFMDVAAPSKPPPPDKEVILPAESLFPFFFSL